MKNYGIIFLLWYDFSVEENMFNLISILPEFVIDAIKDSVSLIPFLFVIFVFIEIFEHYFSHKIDSFVKISKKIGPIVGTFAAIVPQCSFSVIASTLYVKKFISLGTLLSVYIATSDEAIPILLATPNQYPVMIKIILIKSLIALVAGYCIDFVVEEVFHKKQNLSVSEAEISDTEKGCCGHHIKEKKRVRYILHPLKHTFMIFGFIFFVCLCLNYLFEVFGIENMQNYAYKNTLLQPIFFSIFGLIPNCAISVIITQMFIKNIITFGSAIAGLSSSAGLGLLVLIRKNQNLKNTIFIILTLLFISMFAGILIQLFYN